MGAAVVGALFGLLIGTVIGAAILRAACALFNKMAGAGESNDGVPVPQWGRAMVITFATVVVQTAATFLIGLVLADAQNVGAGSGTRAHDFGEIHVFGDGGNSGAGHGARLLANLISIPVAFLVSSRMVAVMLPTTFPRAMRVALLQFVLGIAIFAVIFVVLMLGFGTAKLGGDSWVAPRPDLGE